MNNNSMQAVSDSIIELDKKKINDVITEKGIYEEDGVLIKKWDGDINSESYIADINKDGSRFIGVLNGRLERNGYGIHYYKNGEKYLGYFEQDHPNKQGIYIWSPLSDSKNSKTECYYGRWNNNKKDKNGIYLWVNEPIDNKVFDNANFDAYVGEFDNDKYVRGTYLSKIADDYYLYHGNFDSEGKKSDDNAFFYSSKFDRVLHGKIDKDIFISAYVTFFDSKTGAIKNMAYSTFDKFGSVNKIVLQDDLKPEEFENEKGLVSIFRDVILGIDYFGYLYEKYHEIKDFIKNNMNSIDILEDKNKFPNIIKLSVCHNSNNIYYDIESKALQKKVNL